MKKSFLWDAYIGIAITVIVAVSIVSVFGGAFNIALGCLLLLFFVVAAIKLDLI